MSIEAEYDKINENGGELDLSDTDSLPWLEADEEVEGAGGFDSSQIIGLAAILLVLGAIFVGLVYFLSNYNRGPVEIADGSLIEAPEGPYKERPEDPGGKEFPGTGEVAPVVGQGESPDARLADATGAGSGDQDLNVAMPPIGGGAPAAPKPAPAPAPAPAPVETQAAPAAPAAPAAKGKGVGVQVGAYSSRARAQQGWSALLRQSSALKGFDNRIVEGQADRGSVFRLQAVAPSLAEANALCSALKRDGLDCQVKP